MICQSMIERASRASETILAGRMILEANGIRNKP